VSVLSDVRARLQALVFRRREERELADELRFHLEMEAEYRRGAGLSAEEARRQSIIALGGVERVTEDVRDARGVRLLLDSVGDFRFALRTLGRSAGFTTVAVLTLTVGIGGTAAVFSAVDTVLLQPLPYQQPGQLVRLYQPDSSRLDDRAWVTPVHFLAYRSRTASFEAAAAMRTYSESGADIGTGEGARRIRLLPVSAGYFDVVRVHPELGTGFQVEDEHGYGSGDPAYTGAAKVVLSHRLWREHLAGDRSAVGRTLSLNGRPFVIAGVMPEGFVDPVAGAVDGWVPLDLSQGSNPQNATNHHLTVIARLLPSASIAQAQAELDVLSAALARQYPAASGARARLYPLKQEVVGSSGLALEITLGAVGLVLLLVCVNIANLLLVRGSGRAREFAVRSALGADRTRLIRQMLIESLTLAVAGGAAGLVVARLAMAAIVALAAGRVPRLTALSLDLRLLVFSLLVASLAGVLFGLAPALRAARTQPGDVLRDESRSTTGGAKQSRLRASLVVAQLALAFVLLVGGGLLQASFQRLRQVHLGVRADHVWTFELNLPSARYDSTARARFYEDFASRVEALPGVRAAGGISKLPATGLYHSWGTHASTGPLAGDRRAYGDADQRIVSGEYFRAVGIPLLEGRLFDQRDDVGAPDRVVVSRSLAVGLFPGVSAVGQTLSAGGRASEIIGVVGNVAVDNEGRSALYVYHAHRQWAGERHWALTQVVATTGSAETPLPQLCHLLRELDPGLVAYRPMTLGDAIGRGAAVRLFTMRMIVTFAALALGLAALGLFGVLSYGVKLRSQEFAIRSALGAGPGVIRRMVLRQGLTMAAIGIGVGLLGALALSKLMTSLLFQVSPLDPPVLLSAAAFLAIVAGVAAYLPARRATAVDPRSALQQQ
jgi:predicted permease